MCELGGGELNTTRVKKHGGSLFQLLYLRARSWNPSRGGRVSSKPACATDWMAVILGAVYAVAVHSRLRWILRHAFPSLLLALFSFMYYSRPGMLYQVRAIYFDVTVRFSVDLLRRSCLMGYSEYRP